MAAHKPEKSVEHYVLETGHAGESRLNLLHEVYGPSTESLLIEIGLKPGMSVADIGCGLGIVTSFMAQKIGPTGKALGVDNSAEQLNIARMEADNQGIDNVRFLEANVYSLGLERESFDIVFARSLLSHLQHPLKALNEMSTLVRPGGVLICEDVDMATIFSDPSTPEYERMVQLFLLLGKEIGSDVQIGSRLSWMFRKLGYSRPKSLKDQPRYRTGEAKRYWEYTLYEVAPTLIKAGILTHAEQNDLSAGLKRIGTDDATVISQAVKTQVWAAKETT
jgi:2-polyprenyl-3-methyl-5-hydroxy-6-metoxy-1,4-benzoquinol methylase